jgi:DNA (cytosine-5)-methyltransferase 1
VRFYREGMYEPIPTPLLSLFSGAGGLDLGFSKAGFQTLIAFDHNVKAVESFNANHRNKPAFVGDVAKLTGAQIQKELQKISAPMPVGAIGGPPCQGFSRGNVTMRPRDPRNRLPYQFARLLREVSEFAPLDFFLFENVSGLLRPTHALRWRRIRTAFEKAGFRIFAQELNAVDFGLPQVRRRVFLVGLNSARFPDLEFEFPSGGSRYKARTVEDAIGHLPEPVLFSKALHPKDVPFHPNHWTMQPKSARFKTGEFNRWRSFRRLEWSEPSPTVAYGNREIHIHPTGKRRLSMLEAMLLQGFPQSYRIEGNLSDQVTQICNAVPPPVALAVARALRAQLYGSAVKRAA